MRARVGVVAVGLMVIGALWIPANTKTAEARANVAAAPAAAAPAAVSLPAAPTLVRAVSGPPAQELAATRAELVAPMALEIITPPPADLRLENPKQRRLLKHEITPAMLQLAAQIVRKHYAKPVGTQVEVEVEGKRVIARLERHFHPEGGPVKPWGFHPGVSLFVAR